MKQLKSSVELGQELETAVMLLEQGILKSFPSYREDLFIVEPRKRVVVNGVTHELDLCVTINHPQGYDSRFIFECKNRKRSTTKNDIIIFAEKVRAVQAQKGYFIARAFTRDALAQAHQDRRLQTLVVEAPKTISPPLLAVRVVVPRKPNIWLSVRTRDGGSLQWDARTFRRAMVRAGTRSLTLHDYVEQWLVEILNDQHRRLCGAGLHGGEYHWTREDERTFPAAEIFLEEYELASIEMVVVSSTAIFEPPSRMQFSFKDRGHVQVFMPAELPDDLSVAIQIVTHRPLEIEAQEEG